MGLCIRSLSDLPREIEGVQQKWNDIKIHTFTTKLQCRNINYHPSLRGIGPGLCWSQQRIDESSSFLDRGQSLREGEDQLDYVS